MVSIIIKIIFLSFLFPISLQLSEEKMVSEALDDVIEMMERLVDEYNYQDWQLNKMHDILTVLKYGYNSLRYQLSAAECSMSELISQSRIVTEAVEDQVQQVERLVENITACVEDANSTLETIESIIHPCGPGDWELVVEKDFSLRGGDDCPDNWTEVMEGGRRFCGGESSFPASDTCDSATFNIDREYRRVCGKIVGYGYGINTAVQSLITGTADIDGPYVDGLSLTHGAENSRTHIWTFAIGATDEVVESSMDLQLFCPCHRASQDFQSFIGNDIFCESGQQTLETVNQYHLDDPLWDGRQCIEECCNSSPYFVKALDQSTSNPLELRLCNSQHSRGTIFSSDNLVEEIEIFVE